MTTEFTEENFLIEFNEDQNFVEIQYQGVNAALLGSLSAQVAALQAALNAALSGLNGSLGTLSASLSSLSTLVTVQGNAIVDEAALRLANDALLGNDLVGASQDLATAIENEATTRAAAILAEAAARGAAIGSATGIIITDVANLATSVTALATNLGAAEAAIISVSDALSTEVGARAAQYSAILADFGNTNASVLSESVARADADSALAIAIDALSAASGGKTFRQASAPTTGMSAGDLWFDSDDDNRVYRYDGTSWVPTDDARISAALASVVSETLARTTADSALAADISVLSASLTTETSNRTAGDASLTSSIATVSAAVTSEASARASADAAIASDVSTVAANLVTETSNRTSADAGLSSSISTVSAAVTAESSARASADSALASDISTVSANLSTETSNRVSGDASLSSSISTVSAAVTAESTARASADSALSSSISTVSASVSTETSDRIAGDNALSSSISSVAASVTTEASARASADGVIEGKYSVKVDVNGYVSGFGLISTANNAAPTSEFVVTADAFKIFNGSSPISPFQVVGGSVYMTNVVIGGQTNGTPGGRITWTNGTYMKVVGVGFGSTSQFIEWYGPYFASLASCTEANAIAYLKVNGSAYFGGSLSAGVLSNAARTSNTAATAFVEVGPFGTNGNSKNVVVNYELVYTTETASSTAPGDPVATVRLYRKVGAGSYVEISSQTFTGSRVSVNNTGPGVWEHDYQAGGSWSLTDTDASTSDFTYKAEITSRTTFGTILSLTQEVGVISTEA